MLMGGAELAISSVPPVPVTDTKSPSLITVFFIIPVPTERSSISRAASASRPNSSSVRIPVAGAPICFCSAIIYRVEQIGHVTLDNSGRLFVHDCAIRVRQLPKEIVDVLIVGECWQDHEKKNDERFFHLNLPSMDHAGPSKRRATRLSQLHQGKHLQLPLIRRHNYICLAEIVAFEQQRG